MALVPEGNSSMWYVSCFTVRAIGVCGVFNRYSLPSERCRHACDRMRRDDKDHAAQRGAGHGCIGRMLIPCFGHTWHRAGASLILKFWPCMSIGE